MGRLSSERDAQTRRAITSTARGPLPDAEHFLLDVIDTIRHPLLVLDPDFTVTQANSAFFRTFLVGPADTIGKTLFSLGDGQWDIPSLHELLRDKLVITPHLEDFDVDHVFPGIGRKIMLLNAKLISHGTHAPRMILLAIEDITERRFTEWRLAEHSRELERSNAALDEFASVASHDLQEPLRKIMSFGERLNTAAGPLLAGDGKHSLERMLHAAGRMRTLVTDVLVYAQVTTRVLPFTATDLSWVMREVLIDLDTTIADAGAVVDVGALPVIDADPLQMRQLIQNLLSNAIKYHRAGVPPVITVRALTDTAGRCTITVSDNGIGFSQEYAEQIFMMFQRLHNRAAYPGSGIGLSICRKIAERHGGTITAFSTPGEGATFSVTLPVTHVTPDHVP